MTRSRQRVSEDHLPDLFSEAQWAKLATHFGLSPRQAGIARLMCRGMRTASLAKALGLSPSTVRMHTIGLFRRMQVHDRIGVPVRLVLADRELRKAGRVG